MSNEGYELIKSWAAVWTWHTPHPLDERRFHEALYDVYREVGPELSIDMLRQATERHASSIAGTPVGRERKEVIDRFMEEASVIVNFLRNVRI